MTSLRRPLPWISRTDHQAALEAARAAERAFIADWLEGVARSHEADGKRRDGSPTSNPGRVLNGEDHRLIAFHLRTLARDFLGVQR